MIHAQTFFISSDFQQYFVVQIFSNDNDKNNNNDDQSIWNSFTLKDEDDTAIIRCEWADAREKHEQKLKLINERIMKTD